jgi:sarcosine oxidase subunit gamma
MADLHVRPQIVACRFIFRGNRAAADACGAVFGAPLSHEACRAAHVGARMTLGLGPDEWMLMANDNALQAQLAAALATTPHSLVDVSARDVALVVSGGRAAALLNSAVPLDLDLRAFPVGMCTRTVFAKAEIILWRMAPDAFHVGMGRSFAPYVRGLLDAASAASHFANARPLPPGGLAAGQTR